jgi:myosin heavy subunit
MKRKRRICNSKATGLFAKMNEGNINHSDFKDCMFDKNTTVEASINTIEDLTIQQELSLNNERNTNALLTQNDTIQLQKQKCLQDLEELHQQEPACKRIEPIIESNNDQESKEMTNIERPKDETKRFYEGLVSHAAQWKEELDAEVDKLFMLRVENSVLRNRLAMIGAYDDDGSETDL